MGTKQLRGFKAITGEKPSKVAYGGRDSETMSSCSSFIFQMLGQQLLLPVKSRWLHVVPVALRYVTKT